MPESGGGRHRRRSGSGALREWESFIGPTGYTAEHQFDRAAELRQLQGRAVSAIAMRTGAIDHEQRVLGPDGHALRRHLAMRKIERTRHVAARVRLGSARIDEHEIDGSVR